IALLQRRVRIGGEVSGDFAGGTEILRGAFRAQALIALFLIALAHRRNVDLFRLRCVARQASAHFPSHIASLARLARLLINNVDHCWRRVQVSGLFAPSPRRPSPGAPPRSRTAPRGSSHISQGQRASPDSLRCWAYASSPPPFRGIEKRW